MSKQKTKQAWSWVPSLYFAEGLPYVAVVTISVIMYKRMGISNTDIALFTSLLYLPWVIKPFWSPLVDLLKTKRWWVLQMQLLLAVGFAGIAFAIPLSFFFQCTLAFFWLLAFSSATHDIAADGFYMLALEPTQQASFVGIRSTFYRLATIMGQGVLVILAGFIETYTGNIPLAWSLTFFVLAGLFLFFHFYHRFSLPRVETTTQAEAPSLSSIITGFTHTWRSFFKKPHIASTLFFLLSYRFSEAQALKLISPFLLDAREQGGLGLSTGEVGFAYGTLGIAALLIGGILGGYAIAKGGLKKWLWPMALIMLSTIAVFVYLSYFQIQNLWIINSCIFVEQFGYGFGFTAYLMYMIQFAEGEHKTTHYAFCTGFMALGMMLPGLFAGWLQEQLGYTRFFIWVMISCLLPILSVALLKVKETTQSSTH